MIPLFHLLKKIKKKILGVTCHNSKKLCKIAIENKADYVAFGSFYLSKLKPKAIKSNLSILGWAKNNCKKNSSNWRYKRKKL